MSLPLLSTLYLTTVTLSLYYNLPESQINRLQQIPSCLAGTVVKAPKSSHVTAILRSLYWLKINERIEYKLLSLTYKVLTTSQPVSTVGLISIPGTMFTVYLHQIFARFQCLISFRCSIDAVMHPETERPFSFLRRLKTWL